MLVARQIQKSKPTQTKEALTESNLNKKIIKLNYLTELNSTVQRESLI